ncbi:MAG: AI-2E family transporter [Sandaracinus sp.]
MQTTKVEHVVAIAPRTMLLATLGLALAWALVQLFPVVLVLATAAILAGTLSPLVTRLERRGVRRGLAIALVFGGLVAVVLALLFLTAPALVDQLQALSESEPEMRSELARALASWPITAPLARWVRTVRYASLFGASTEVALVVSARVLEIATYAISTVVLALYFLIDRDRLRGIVFALVPRRHHLRAARVAAELERIVGGFVRGQLITSTLLMGFTYALLTLVGVESPLPMAFLAGMMDVLPYVGVLFAIIPAALAAVPVGAGAVATVFVTMCVYSELESRLIVPRVYGTALRLPSSIVLVALLAGGTLLGLVGALLALPIAAAIRMLVEELRVELPGQPAVDAAERAAELAREDAYLRRTSALEAERAAAVAVQMSDPDAPPAAG